jgi:transcription elongation factor Elf1
MSLFIEQKYIQLVSAQLEKFKRKTPKLYNFRCPFCGDSKRNKTKARGYFYQIQNRFNFKCHNCNVSTTLGNFLKEHNQSLYRKYVLERFNKGENGHSNYEKPNPGDDFKDTVKKTNKLIIIPTKKEKPNKNNLSAITLDKLPDNHYAKEYILNRRIPKKFHKMLLFTENFSEFVETILPSKYTHRLKPDERIIIPFYDKDKKLVAFTGRSLSGKSKFKYITIKIDDNAKKIFGIDRIDFTKQIYVVEGPFDSFFLPNCLAAAGSDLLSIDVPKETIFIYDNERSNNQIFSKMLETVDRGYSIFIWPIAIEGKDINDLIQKGFTQKKIIELIQKNTFSGLKAKLQLQKWRNGYK